MTNLFMEDFGNQNRNFKQSIVPKPKTERPKKSH